MRSLAIFSAGALIATLALSTGASAQTAAPSAAPAAPAMQGCGGGGANPMSGIQLTPAQRQQIKQLHEQFRAQYPCGSKVPPAARQQLRTEVENVLTPAQRAQYQTNVQAEQPTHSPPPN